ncbi:selenocysteine-specific translation elongation factor [Yersinia hibernica]|uniref:Selenocysteine-specific elongation factor n=1 Tax=Yersinia enterocolitica LC20 TaxID=1443113 RepID=A0A7U4GBU9_YEREN|nr:selenocysteine-specific translation elongation factor [Yersinia hibernica]AHM71307.1 selenocysteinyl-tRNA-specific translation elongation factor SelB [Yersinia hibernica]OVZ85111.1 selenocysteinyl-tRNA-specific translation elongation factor SelB [Yersinia kristensenii]
MIIATAGHVDHGKTTLLQALTGVNADRLPEEKQRGMTIDLGYAYWPQPDGNIIGFIDVPGHEKFLANMLAGVGGINHALLVVACDDGVMAQTREHLAILRLTGRPTLTVALTKADRVDDERIAQVRQQVMAELLAQGWQAEQVTLFVTAATAERGISELRAHLARCNQQDTDNSRLQRRFRLAVDRAFSVKGAGLVVTGTALAGKVAVGDTLWLTGSDGPVRVRGIHAQNQDTQQAQAGQRIALNITGNVSKEQISRGDWLLAQQPPEAVDRVLVIVDADEPIQHWQPLHLHHAASHITGRFSLLNNPQPDAKNPVILAELLLDTPLWLVENDSLILRDIAAKKTLGGARVIHLAAPKRGKRQPAFLAWLTALAQATTDRAVLALHLAQGPVSVDKFSWARQLNSHDMATLLAGTDCVVAGDIALSSPHAQQAQQTLLHVLCLYHQQHSDQLGLGRARLRRMALPTLDEALVFRLIDNMLAQGALKNTRGWLHLPEHGLGFTEQEQALWQQVAPYFADDPWWVRDLATELGRDESEVRALLRKAAQLGYITAIVADRYYLSQRIEQFADLIRELDASQGSASTTDFRDRLGIGRKLAIQILEFFDRSGFTRRRGNDHLLRDRGLFSSVN